VLVSLGIACRNSWNQGRWDPGCNLARDRSQANIRRSLSDLRRGRSFCYGTNARIGGYIWVTGGDRAIGIPGGDRDFSRVAVFTPAMLESGYPHPSVSVRASDRNWGRVGNSN
jgi:hypothetical protein